ncbi:MAG: hypothetical protein ACI8XU_002028 [Kiritimatiellia bacterium]|jgi:hypothetical protein
MLNIRASNILFICLFRFMYTITITITTRESINPPSLFISNPARLGSLSVSSSVNRAVQWFISPKSDRFANRLTKFFKMILHGLASYLSILLV